MWAIRRHSASAVLPIQHGGTFYTNTPGYRLQFRCQIDRLHGDIYFCVRMLQGVFDDQLDWPFAEKFKIRISDRKKTTGVQDWFVPGDTGWGREKPLARAVGKRQTVLSGWFGPFDVSRYLERELFHLEISPHVNSH